MTPSERYQARQARQRERRWLAFSTLWSRIGMAMRSAQFWSERRAHDAKIREVIEGFRNMRTDPDPQGEEKITMSFRDRMQ